MIRNRIRGIVRPPCVTVLPFAYTYDWLNTYGARWITGSGVNEKLIWKLEGIEWYETQGTMPDTPHPRSAVYSPRTVCSNNLHLRRLQLPAVPVSVKEPILTSCSGSSTCGAEAGGTENREVAAAGMMLFYHLILFPVLLFSRSLRTASILLDP